MPSQVPHRVAILLGDGEIRYLDASLRRGALTLPWRVVAMNDKRVLVSRYLSGSVRVWLDENDLSYVDATRNLRLVSRPSGVPAGSRCRP